MGDEVPILQSSEDLRTGTTIVHVKQRWHTHRSQARKTLQNTHNDTHNYTTNKKDSYTCKVTKTYELEQRLCMLSNDGIRTGCSGVKHERLAHWTPNYPYMLGVVTPTLLVHKD
jgi:hypothetical protein